MSRARQWVRRAALSALAGGGLTGAGVGGALTGGASAAETPAETPTPVPSPASTTPAAPVAGEAPTTTTTATQAPPPAPSTAAPTLAPNDGAGAGPGEKQPSAQQNAQQKHRGRAPKVAVQDEQPATIVSPGGTPVVAAPAAAPAPASSSTPSQVSSANIAPAPQLAAGQLAAPSLSGSLVSMQALGFYRIPLFLLPIYQAAASQYGVPWQVLAAINEVETNYGTDQAVSSAGAVGWMQFMPETWLQYGVDAVNAGYADPYNPVDAIFAAARYLHAAGASGNLRTAIFAYNHSEAYVQSVLLRARLIASYPDSVIATLTGLTEGSLPVAGARLASDPQAGAVPGAAASGAPASSSNATASASPAQGQAPAASSPATPGASAAALPGSILAPMPAVSAALAARRANAPAPPAQLSRLIAAKDAPVIAVKDGRVVALGRSHRLGSYLVLRDTYGDVFTYAGLGETAPTYRLPQPARLSIPKGALGGAQHERDAKPAQAASDGLQTPLTLRVAARHGARHPATARRVQADRAPSQPEAAPQAGQGKVRVFAHPGNPDALAAMRAQARRSNTPLTGWGALRKGSLVSQGTVLGRLRPLDSASPYGSLRFAVRPPGDRGAIDPKPILENWRQLYTALHPQGARPATVLAGATAPAAFLLGRGELTRAVLVDPHIRLSACDRQQVARGRVDERLLALLVFLSRSGLQPTVGELRCGHLLYTPAGPRVDSLPNGDMRITALNGVPVSGHQGAGTLADVTVRTLLTARRGFLPRRIVSLMRYPNSSVTLAEPDHGDYIEIVLPRRAPARQTTLAGAAAQGSGAIAQTKAVTPTAGRVPAATLDSAQWDRLMSRIGALPTPNVSRRPSPAAVRTAGSAKR